MPFLQTSARADVSRSLGVKWVFVAGALLVVAMWIVFAVSIAWVTSHKVSQPRILLTVRLAMMPSAVRFKACAQRPSAKPQTGCRPQDAVLKVIAYLASARVKLWQADIACSDAQACLRGQRSTGPWSERLTYMILRVGEACVCSGALHGARPCSPCHGSCSSLWSIWSTPAIRSGAW